MRITVIEIDDILKKHDIEGLLEMGAPQDEYMDEAQDVYEALEGLQKQESVFDHVLQILTKVWRDSFNLDETDMHRREANIVNCAKEISEKL